MRCMVASIIYLVSVLRNMRATPVFIIAACLHGCKDSTTSTTTTTTPRPVTPTTTTTTTSAGTGSSAPVVVGANTAPAASAGVVGTTAGSDPAQAQPVNAIRNDGAISVSASAGQAQADFSVEVPEVPRIPHVEYRAPVGIH